MWGCNACTMCDMLANVCLLNQFPLHESDIIGMLCGAVVPLSFAPLLTPHSHIASARSEQHPPNDMQTAHIPCTKCATKVACSKRLSFDPLKFASAMAFEAANKRAISMRVRCNWSKSSRLKQTWQRVRVLSGQLNYVCAQRDHIFAASISKFRLCTQYVQHRELLFVIR